MKLIDQTKMKNNKLNTFKGTKPEKLDSIINPYTESETSGIDETESKIN